MFVVYEMAGYKFYEASDGKMYISNLQEMLDLNGVKMTEDCLGICDFYNSVVELNAKDDEQVMNG